MTGNINMDSHNIDNLGDIVKSFYIGDGSTTVYVKPKANWPTEKVYLGVSGEEFYQVAANIMLCNTFRATVFDARATVAGFYTRSIDDSYIMLKAWDNDINALVEIARMSSASEPELGISRAGDIAFLTGKNLKLYYAAYNVDMEGLTSPLTVNFSPAMADTDYMIFLSWNLATSLWWTDKTTSSFKINFVPSPAPAGALVDWILMRTSW